MSGDARSALESMKRKGPKMSPAASCFACQREIGKQYYRCEHCRTTFCHSCVQAKTMTTNFERGFRGTSRGKGFWETLVGAALRGFGPVCPSCGRQDIEEYEIAGEPR